MSESQNTWMLVDSQGPIFAGTEESVRHLWSYYTTKDPTPEMEEVYKSIRPYIRPYKDYLQLVEVHTSITTISISKYSELGEYSDDIQRKFNEWKHLNMWRLQDDVKYPETFGLWTHCINGDFPVEQGRTNKQLFEIFIKDVKL